MPFDDDARLVARICAGDEKAMEEFSTSYRQFGFAILTRHLNLRSEDADEIFQRFLFHIWENDFQRLRRWSGKTTTYRLAAEAAPIPSRSKYKRGCQFSAGLSDVTFGCATWKAIEVSRCTTR